MNEAMNEREKNPANLAPYRACIFSSCLQQCRHGIVCIITFAALPPPHDPRTTTTSTLHIHYCYPSSSLSSILIHNY
jgi:hypothetical protein